MQLFINFIVVTFKYGEVVSCSMITMFGGYALDEVLKDNTHRMVNDIPNGIPSFAIDELSDRYVIGPVSYRGESHRVALSKEFLDNAEVHTQDDWVDRLQSSEWQLPSGPLMMELMTKLYEERDGQYQDTIAEIQKKLREDFNGWMMTSTRIHYHTARLDEVVHDYRSQDEQTIARDMTGSEGLVTPTSGFDDAIETLFGTRDLALLADVSQWVSGKKLYLRRYTTKVDAQGTLVLGVVSNDGFCIYAGTNISTNWPARGVTLQKIGDV